MAKIFKYSPEMLEILEAGYKTMSVNDLTQEFNQRFKLNKTPGQIKGILSNKKFTCGRNTGQLKKGRLVSVTQGQLDWLANAYKSHRRVDLPELFNQQFSATKTYNQILGLIKNHGLKAGRTGHFKVGVPSWSKGTKGVLKANSGSFKKDRVPHNVVPVGSYRVTSYGYPQYKMAEPNIWENESALMWKAHNGDYLEGMKIYHKDGNKLNTDIDNLVLVDNAESMHLTHLGLKDAPAEFKDSVVLVARINSKVSSIEKGQANGPL